MPAEIPTLGEVLLANLAFERTLPCVFSEVVPQIAALLKDAFALWELALKVELNALRLSIPNFDSLVPIFGNALKRVRVDVVCLTRLRVIKV